MPETTESTAPNRYDDPEWHAAYAAYLKLCDQDGTQVNPDHLMIERCRAALRLRDIEERIERDRA